MDANLSDPCQAGYYIQLSIQASYVVYNIISPLYFIFGLLGHFLCLLTFFQQAKKEKAYGYQIIVTVSNVILIFFTAFYLITFNWLSGGGGGQFSQGAQWYVSCYACMWITARFSITFQNILIVTNQYLSIFMSFDRFRALYKPLVYKPATKIDYILIVLGCFSIGFLSNGFNFFVLEPVPAINGTYGIIRSTFFNETFEQILSHLRSIVALIGLLALYFFNFSIPYLYQKRIKNSKAVVSDQTEKKRKKDAKLLALLSVSESILTTIGATISILFYLFITTEPPCFGSKIPLFIALMDGLMEISSALNFYIFFGLSKEFRRIVFESIGCCGTKPVANTVAPTSSNALASISLHRPSMTPVAAT